LLSLGADINFLLKPGDTSAFLGDQDKVGDTALINAARSPNASAIRLLLEHGADPSLRNHRGESALSVTKEGLANCDPTETITRYTLQPRFPEGQDGLEELSEVDRIIRVELGQLQTISTEVSKPLEYETCLRLLEERGAT
jgi:hypothetical protein